MLPAKRRPAQVGTFVFEDNFNRSDGELAAGNASWTRLSTGNGDASVSSNNLSMTDTFSAGSVYLSPDFGSTDMYVEFDLLTVANSGGPFVIIRAVDENNYIGVRNNTVSIQVYTCIAGVFAFVDGGNGLQANDRIRFEAKGTSISVYVNGALHTGPLTIATHASSTRAGVAARAGVVNNWIDNFKQGVL